MQAAIGQLAVFALAALGFLSALVGLIAFLSILRRVRLLRTPKPITMPVQSTPAQRVREVLKVDASATLIAEFANEQNELKTEAPPPLPDTLPEANAWQMPIRDGSPDQIVILIEPDTGPNAQELLIQKLIEHLEKQEQEIRAG